MTSSSLIPVIDIFAGPGGLGEGFASFVNERGRRSFQLALSIEKDSWASETLKLRSFWRSFEQEPPSDYTACLRGEIDRSELYRRFDSRAKTATRAVVQLALSQSNAEQVRKLVDAAISGRDDWVLIGGPPCQAYSVIGRSRRTGMAGYDPETDERQTLYVDYLQILADNAPPVFVMENVKGLLSATLDHSRLFGRILEDLQNPASAVVRHKRSRPQGRPAYTVHSLVVPERQLTGDPREFVVRADDFGIPQARHRVILLGIRDAGRKPGVLAPNLNAGNTRRAIDGLPRVRSGITDRSEGDAEWMKVIRGMKLARWYRKTETDVRRAMRDAVDDAAPPRARRGGEYLGEAGRDSFVLNHSTRAHIHADIERYFFASCFAQVHQRSPTLPEFPEALLPKHKSAKRAMSGGHFSDRFKVQLAARPASTVTSHISKDGHYYIHYDPTQCRSLTVREAARLQTFPDDYFFCGPRTEQYHQVGNAVPPLLARQIAEIVAGIF